MKISGSGSEPETSARGATHSTVLFCNSTSGNREDDHLKQLNETEWVGVATVFTLLLGGVAGTMDILMRLFTVFLSPSRIVYGIRPRPLPSKSFPIHLSSYYSFVYSLDTGPQKKEFKVVQDRGIGV
jgi:hypothetical protein